MLQTALEFLRKHNEITFATTDGTSPHLRIFQIMRQEGTTLYFATSAKKAVWHELQANPKSLRIILLLVFTLAKIYKNL